MRAVVRRFHSPDVWNLADFQPDDPEVWGILLQVLVGPENAAGEESFDLTVCTPRWLANQLDVYEMLWGRHYLLLKRYDWERLEPFLRGQFEGVEGETWLEIADLLGRFGRWEFEDYTSGA
jgi:hypothetical protein